MFIGSTSCRTGYLFIVCSYSAKESSTTKLRNIIPILARSKIRKRFKHVGSKEFFWHVPIVDPMRYCGGDGHGYRQCEKCTLRRLHWRWVQRDVPGFLFFNGFCGQRNAILRISNRKTLRGATRLTSVRGLNEADIGRTPSLSKRLVKVPVPHRDQFEARFPLTNFRFAAVFPCFDAVAKWLMTPYRHSPGI